MNSSTPLNGDKGAITPPDAPVSRRRLTPRNVALVVRRVILLIAAGGALYLGTRFGLRTLPDDFVSPLVGFGAGENLLIDGRPRPLEVGDVVLLRVEESAPLLARVTNVRDSDGALWCEADNEHARGVRSEEHGWISGGVVAGRVLFGWGGAR